MRYPASEKAEIIQLVEQSPLPVKRMLEKLGIPRATFYRWCDLYQGGGPERRQEYWIMLSGATGQVYGSEYTWRFAKGWETNLDTPGVIQLGYLRNLLISRSWYDLIPDQTHLVVTDGYDSFSGLVGRVSAYLSLEGTVGTLIRKLSGFGSISTNTYVTAARSSDGSLVIAYTPSIRTITVDMSKLAGPATARWYDPTNGM
jgi:hypothetical protein